MEEMLSKEERRKAKRRSFPVSRLFPNMVTIGGLCCGASAVRFALIGKWEAAVIFILAAAVLDAMDGMIARMLKATSEFGAQLDSLTDMISFGVAPALIMYMWALEDFKRYGWAVILFYIVCCALRLARFNVMALDESLSAEAKKEAKRFFTGVPAPAGAIIALTPLMLSFRGLEWTMENQWIIAGYMLMVGVLMASRFPTFSAKNIRINQTMVLPIMVGFGAIVVFIIMEPWMTIPAIVLIYLLSIPFSAWRQMRKR